MDKPSCKATEQKKHRSSPLQANPVFKPSPTREAAQQTHRCKKPVSSYGDGELLIAGVHGLNDATERMHEELQHALVLLDISGHLQSNLGMEEGLKAGNQVPFLLGPTGQHPNRLRTCFRKASRAKELLFLMAGLTWPHSLDITSNMFR